MPFKAKLIAALIGAAALMGAVGVDVAQAGTYPKGGSHHVGGEGATVQPSPDPTTLQSASFAPDMDSVPHFCSLPWSTGSCG